jgi:predicted dehydrogenase
MYAVFTYLRNRGKRPDLNTYPLTMDDPMLLEQSIHHLDLLRYAYDREVETVVADSWNPPTSVYRGDSAVAALLGMTGGLRVSYLGTWTAGTNRFEFRWRTDCADGIFVQAAQEGALSVARRVPGAEISGPRFPTHSEPLMPEDLTPDRFLIDDTVRLLDHYLDVIEGLAEPGPTGRDHLRTLGLLDAIVVSARTGTRVDVEAHLEALGLLR